MRHFDYNGDEEIDNFLNNNGDDDDDGDEITYLSLESLNSEINLKILKLAYRFCRRSFFWYWYPYSWKIRRLQHVYFLFYEMVYLNSATDDEDEKNANV